MTPTQSPKSLLARLHPLLALLTLAGLAASLWAVFFYAPTEREMGIVQRIFYFHVPSAITSYLAYFTVFVASILYLVTRRDQWDLLALSAVELGIMFSVIVLVTGPLWARPIWGVWWRWEPRLTAMLITFTTYVAYLLIRTYGDEGPQTRRMAAVLGILGFANVPFVHYAVRLWTPEQQLHPQEVQLQSQMQQTLYLCFGTFFVLYAFLLSWRWRLARAEQALAAQRQRLAQRNSGG